MAEARDWVGHVGHEWARYADALDALLGPVGAAGLEHLDIQPRQSVLDVGCGAGASAIAMAKAGAHVTGVDLSRSLLSIAKARAQAADLTIEWREEDAAHIWLDYSCDMLFSRCGVMFFENQRRVLSHLRKRLRADGRFVAVVWRDSALNAWARLPLQAARAKLGASQSQLPPPGGTGPFGWATPAPVIADMAAAGWRSIQVDAVERQAVLGGPPPADSDPADHAAAFCLRIGPLASRLRGAEPALRQAIQTDVAAALRPYVTPRGVEIGTSAWIYSAKA